MAAGAVLEEAFVPLLDRRVSNVLQGLNSSNAINLEPRREKSQLQAKATNYLKEGSKCEYEELRPHETWCTGLLLDLLVGELCVGPQVRHHLGPDLAALIVPHPGCVWVSGLQEAARPVI